MIEMVGFHFIFFFRFNPVRITTGSAASPWDHVSPSPAPIRASGYSVKSSSSKYGARSHQLTFSSESSQSFKVCFLCEFVVNFCRFLN